MEGQKQLGSGPDLTSAARKQTHSIDPQMLHSCVGMSDKTHTATVMQTNSPCCRLNTLLARETEPAAWRGNRNTSGYSKEAVP